MGANLLGANPGGSGKGTWGVFDGCNSGSIKSLWLVECDPSAYHGGIEALENAEFVVYQGTLENNSAAYASVVLPMAAPAEQDGTWTNCEGRVQRMVQAIPAPGEAKPAWRIFGETILRLKPTTPFFSAREVMEEVSKSVAGFEGVDYGSIPDEGLLLSLDKKPVTAGEGA